MDNITKYLHKIAYKFPKGYPDMGDPKDKDMLFELIKTVIEAEEEVEITKINQFQNLRVNTLIKILHLV